MIIIAIISILFLTLAAWAFRQMTSFKICPFCAGVLGTWIWMLTAYYLGYRIDIAIPAMLMGGSVIGISYALEKYRKQSLFSRTIFIVAGFEAVYSLIIGMDEDRRRINSTFLKLNSSRKIKEKFEKTKEYWLKYLSKLEFDFKDRDFNGWLLWVKMQPTLRKLFGNSFLPHYDYGKGGRGWRDLWQDALTLLLTEPDKAKDFILDNFKGVRIDGSNATVITKDGDFLGDRNKISRVWMDHGVWPMITLDLYLNETGDSGILFRKAPYFRNHEINRARDIDRTWDPSYGQRLKNAGFRR